MKRWLAVYTGKGTVAGGQGYVLDRECQRGFWWEHLKPWQVIGEHETEEAAWVAVRQCMREHSPDSIFIDEL
jgi:hypothetical protein